MSFNALRHNLASATTATKSIFDEGPDKAEDVDDEAEMPPSELDKLSPTEVSQIQTEIATEMYGFAPLTFTSRVVDLANDVIYRVIDKIEVEVNTRWAEGEGVDEETKQSVAKVGVTVPTYPLQCIARGKEPRREGRSGMYLTM